MNDAISLQYCEYGPDPAKCYEWMKVNLPEHYVRLVGGGIIYMKMHVHTRSTCPLVYVQFTCICSRKPDGRIVARRE